MRLAAPRSSAMIASSQRRLADDRGHLEHAALGRLHHAQARGDELLVRLRQRRSPRASSASTRHITPSRTMHVALEQQAHELVDRARRAAERRARARRARGGTSASCLHSSRSSCFALAGRQRAELDLDRRDLAFAERGVPLVQRRRSRCRGSRPRWSRMPAARYCRKLIVSVPHSSRFSTTSTTGRRSASAVEQALERHEQARLEALRRLEQRRRRPGCRRTARAAGARSRCAISATRCAGTISATPAWILSRLSAGSSPGCRPNRTVSARATGPYACAFSSATPASTSTFGCCVRARAISSPIIRLLPMPGSPTTTANASSGARRTRWSVSSWSCANRGGPPREPRTEIVRARGRDDRALALTLAEAIAEVARLERRRRLGPRGLVERFGARQRRVAVPGQRSHRHPLAARGASKLR